MTASDPALSAAQLATILQASSRPNRALDPLPFAIKGAARRAVIDALVAPDYATKCYFPTHAEYLLTDVGAAVCACVDATADTGP
jgi:hypothetical protein